MEGFHAAYKQGRLVPPPHEYMDLILVPAILHIDPLAFDDYPVALKGRIRRLLTIYIREGWGGNPETIKSKS